MKMNDNKWIENIVNELISRGVIEEQFKWFTMELIKQEESGTLPINQGVKRRRGPS